MGHTEVGRDMRLSIHDYELNDLIYHETPSGIKYIGLVNAIYPSTNLISVGWFTVPNGAYFMDSDAEPERVDWIGHMPKGAK